MEETAPVTSTQLNKKKKKNRQFSAALHLLLPNGAILFFLFRRFDALLQGFHVLLRSILSEPGDEKTCLRKFFGQLRFNLVCSATDVS